jgi:hypothetical protein
MYRGHRDTGVVKSKIEFFRKILGGDYFLYPPIEFFSNDPYLPSQGTLYKSYMVRTQNEQEVRRKFVPKIGYPKLWTPVTKERLP